jgi:pimeloyl-ACP methyl ester carboxylesterase
LPGARVSEDAFVLLQHFFRAGLAADFDVVAWVPPHHMVRQVEGHTDGDGLFGIDLRENLRLDREMVREVRTLMDWLRRRGVSRIGLWGGSLGGSVAWLTAAVEPVDHVALMIPIVDWRTMVLLPAEMAGVGERLTALGFSSSLQAQALLAGSPVSYRVALPSTRVHLRYARFDQLTPEATTLAFARAAGIDDVVGFERSHASVLLTPAVFSDYEAFLRRMRPAPG